MITNPHIAFVHLVPTTNELLLKKLKKGQLEERHWHDAVLSTDPDSFENGIRYCTSKVEAQKLKHRQRQFIELNGTKHRLLHLDSRDLNVQRRIEAEKLLKTLVFSNCNQGMNTWYQCAEDAFLRSLNHNIDQALIITFVPESKSLLKTSLIHKPIMELIGI